MAAQQSKNHPSRPEQGRFFLSSLHLQRPDIKAHLIFWLLAAGGVVLDLWTKHAVFDWLRFRGSVEVIDGFFQLVMAENTGAAFGIAAGKTFLLIAVSVVALLAVLAVFLFSATSHRIVHIALGLFAGGVCGNLYDRIFNEGRVRDFIDVVYWPGRHWPAFNVADSMLCIAVGLLIISNLMHDKK